MANAIKMTMTKRKQMNGVVVGAYCAKKRKLFKKWRMVNNDEKYFLRYLC
jgi:hypothetical protein